MTIDPTIVPAEVVAALADRQPVHLGAVTMYAPTRPGAKGSAGQHRIVWIDPDDGKRITRGATKLDDAWRRTVATAEQLQRRTERRADRSLAGVTVQQLVELYLRPTVHLNWSENRRKTVTTLLNNWVAHPRVTVSVGGATIEASRLLVDNLTPALCEQMLQHCLRQKAYRTYVDAHREFGTLLRWAAREGLRPREDELPGRIGLAKPSDPSKHGGSGQGVQPVDPDDIPPTSAVDDLRAVALEMHGQQGVNAIDLMAFGGMRIGEALGLIGDDETMYFDQDEQVYRPYIWQRVHANRVETAVPKHGRRRHAWLPPWMTDQFRDAIADAGAGPLIPAPEGGWFPAQRFRARRFNKWLEAADWPLLPESDTTNRKWKWTAHSLRHYAASWMLNDLGLAPDDVAAFLGHGNGHQIWVMYSRVRPGLVRRATALASEAGDPRAAAGAEKKGDRGGQ